MVSLGRRAKRSKVGVGAGRGRGRGREKRVEEEGGRGGGGEDEKKKMGGTKWGGDWKRFGGVFRGWEDGGRGE